MTRIIPARAGFTGELIRRGLHFRDHPRSRGVYAEPAYNLPYTGGSSPLARGLPRGDRLRAARRRIIPARAGFTGTLRELAAARGDHPRSRGVYTISSTASSAVNGSSPLARGLPLRILGIPTNPYSTRPRLPSLPT